MADQERIIRIWAISRLYGPNFSGAAIQDHQIFSRLVRQGFSVTVLTSSDWAASHLRGQQIKQDGVEIRYLASRHQKPWDSVANAPMLNKIVAYLKGLLGNLSLESRTACTLWREGQPNEIVRIIGPGQFTFITIGVARLRGMHPVVRMTLLGSDDPSAIIKKQRLMFFRILRLAPFNQAKAIIGLSSAQVQSCLSAGLNPHKVFKIPGGVDLNKYHPVSVDERVAIRQKLGLKPDSRFIVFVGAAIARKGLDVLAKAFIQISSQINNVESLFVGPCDFDDPVYWLGRNVRDEIDAAGYSSQVHWIGRIDNVYEYLQAADVFCLPSRREGFGHVIIEAMAVGLPVIVSRLEGVTTDMIQSEREGMLVADHDPDDYAAALMQLLANEDLAKTMGNAARSRVESVFSLELITQTYAQFYRDLAGPQPLTASAS